MTTAQKETTYRAEMRALENELRHTTDAKARREIQAQANLYAAGCDTPGTRAAAKKYNDLTTAIALLAQPQQTRML